MKKTCFSILSVLVLLLAGCDAATPKDVLAFPLRGNSAFPYINSFFENMAAAVGKDGTRYFAWQGCDEISNNPLHCGINVTWSRAGERNATLVAQHTAETSDYDPDITVTDDGIVYLIWTRSENVKGYYCWSKFDPHSPGTIPCNPVAAASRLYGYPKIASYGNFVYAVYGTMENEYAQLRYRQLNPLDKSGGKVSFDPTDHNVLPAIAVSSAGTLHVAWIEGDADTNAPLLFSYANNGSGSGDMRQVCPCLSRQNAYGLLTAIGIAPLDANRVYVAYATTGELLTVTYPQDGSQIGQEGGPLPAGNWGIDSLALAVKDGPGNSTAYVAFSASSSATPGDREIYLKPWDGDPVAQTDNNSEDVDLRMVPLVENSSGFSGLVLVWRNWFSPCPPGDGSCPIAASIQGEIWPVSGRQTIVVNHHPSLVNDYWIQDLAANGPYIAGAWVRDTQTGINSSVRDLTAVINTYKSSLPVVFR